LSFSIFIVLKLKEMTLNERKYRLFPQVKGDIAVMNGHPGGRTCNTGIAV
jgi:hypothetical protein